MKHKRYDPVKIWNKRNFLNKVALKARYDLMLINNSYQDEIFKENNIFHNAKVHALDKDIQDFKQKLRNSEINELSQRAQVINNTINHSEIYKQLDEADHTSLVNIKTTMRKAQVKTKKADLHEQVITAPKRTKLSKEKNKERRVLKFKCPFDDQQHFRKIKYQPKLTETPKRGRILLPEIEPNQEQFTERKMSTNTDSSKIISKNKQMSEYTAINLNNQTELMKNYLYMPEEIEKQKEITIVPLESIPNLRKKSRQIKLGILVPEPSMPMNVHHSSNLLKIPSNPCLRPKSALRSTNERNLIQANNEHKADEEGKEYPNLIILKTSDYSKKINVISSFELLKMRNKKEEKSIRKDLKSIIEKRRDEYTKFERVFNKINFLSDEYNIH